MYSVMKLDCMKHSLCLFQTQEYIITQLNPYQMVNVTITATNGGGTSSHSNELSGRTSEAGWYNFKPSGVISKHTC